jgi:hypothetical protein
MKEGIVAMMISNKYTIVGLEKAAEKDEVHDLTLGILEKERNETMANPEFQDWMRTLKVSQLHEDRSVKINAYDLQMQYDTKRYSKLNFSI